MARISIARSAAKEKLREARHTVACKASRRGRDTGAAAAFREMNKISASGVQISRVKRCFAKLMTIEDFGQRHTTAAAMAVVEAHQASMTADEFAALCDVVGCIKSLCYALQADMGVILVNKYKACP